MNPLLQRFRERVEALTRRTDWGGKRIPRTEFGYYTDIDWTAVENFWLTELSARDARVVEIIEKLKTANFKRLGYTGEKLVRERVLNDLLEALTKE